MDPVWRRTLIAAVMFVVGVAGWFTLGGLLFAAMVLAAFGLLMTTWVVHGGNDMYGPRTRYERAEDLVRADDDDSSPPHPGPLPPQPPSW